MKTNYKILIGVVVLLIIIRLVLPYVVLHYANNKLARLDGYYGHVKDINISLLRGSYVLNNLYVNKIDSTTQKQTGFFKTKTIDLSLEWGPLFRGALVGKLEVNSPVLIFKKDKVALEDVKKDTPDFQKLFEDFMPLQVDRFEINNGELHYVDSTFEPVIGVSLKNVHILAKNLTNTSNDTVELPSTITAGADVYEGVLNLHMKMNLPARQPTFVLDAELNSTNLVLLNDFFKEYGKFDVNRGTFGLYTEMAAKDGSFIGYVKPVIKDVKVVALQGRDASGISKIWGGLVGAVALVFENKDKDQVATKIPIEGKFTDPKPDILFAVWQVLQNAFVQALSSSIDNQISLSSIKGN